MHLPWRISELLMHISKMPRPYFLPLSVCLYVAVHICVCVCLGSVLASVYVCASIMRASAHYYYILLLGPCPYILYIMNPLLGD